MHAPAVRQWRTDSKGSSPRGSEAPYPCTCSDPNTVSRCRFYPSTFCQLLPLLVPSLTPVPSSPLPHARTHGHATPPRQVLRLRQSPSLASILRAREHDFIRADPRERTLKRRPRLNRTVAQRDIAPACSTFRSRYFSLYLPCFSHPLRCCYR